MKPLISVALGGALGAIFRYWFGESISFPYGTLVVNLLGCFLIGLLWELTGRNAIDIGFRPLLITGILGALTTFSSFGLDVYRLVSDGRGWQAVGYVIATNILGVVLVFLGTALGK